jgi:hypothetical protein
MLRNRLKFRSRIFSSVHVRKFFTVCGITQNVIMAIVSAYIMEMQHYSHGIF